MGLSCQDSVVRSRKNYAFGHGFVVLSRILWRSRFISWSRWNARQRVAWVARLHQPAARYLHAVTSGVLLGQRLASTVASGADSLVQGSSGLPSHGDTVVAEMSSSASTAGEGVPDGLAVQVPLILAALDALGIAVVGKDGYEADDVIGSLASTAPMPVDIVTGDRDLFPVGRR